jgi:hypothetical protein
MKQEDNNYLKIPTILGAIHALRTSLEAVELAFKLFSFFSLCIYVCVCVCVCARARAWVGGGGQIAVSMDLAGQCRPSMAQRH